jgi:3',5'-cyclic-AMP phosphodiesterase
MIRQNKRAFIKSLSALLLGAFLPKAAKAKASTPAYHHLVVLGDLHLPGGNLAIKEQVLQTINAWNDLEMVVAVGDLCEEDGSAAEYRMIKSFFAKLTKPLLPIVGNHDFIYSWFKKGAKSVRGDAENREQRLHRFRDTFGLSSGYYSRMAGDYTLIFLSTDSPGHLAEISPTQTAWFGQELERNRQRPTIVFFHAPLDGTLDSYNNSVNTPNFVAQPALTIRNLLADNPQVFMWVSGHTHTPPSRESFASAINLYDGRVMNIHCTDMQDRNVAWTNSLFLYPDRVVVKTYDHGKGAWMRKLEREISNKPA